MIITIIITLINNNNHHHHLLLHLLHHHHLKQTQPHHSRIRLKAMKLAVSATVTHNLGPPSYACWFKKNPELHLQQAITSINSSKTSITIQKHLETIDPSYLMLST